MILESEMNKRILGIKIITILSVVLCLAFAVLFWLLVKYSESDISAVFKYYAVLGG